jgi:hypothetical protein
MSDTEVYMRTARAIAGLAATIFLTATASAGADVLPVGVWTLNEGKGSVAHDFSGHRDDGLLEGAPQWTKGRFDHALRFDGVASTVRVSDNPRLDTPEVTVSAWVNSSASPGIYKYVVAKGANICSAASYGIYTGSNGGLEFYVSSNQGYAWMVSPDAGQGVWNGQWHNVIGTYNGSTVRLYVDGRQVGSGTPDTVPIAYGLPTSNDLTIGDYVGCSSEDFTGSIDEVKVFDRALSAIEISATYQLSRLLPTGFPTDLIL